jgi:hypothetical protein
MAQLWLGHYAIHHHIFQSSSASANETQWANSVTNNEVKITTEKAEVIQKETNANNHNHHSSGRRRLSALPDRKLCANVTAYQNSTACCCDTGALYLAS